MKKQATKQCVQCDSMFVEGTLLNIPFTFPLLLVTNRQIYIHSQFSIGWRLFAQQSKLAFDFLIFNKAFGLMQGLLDFESPEDLEMDPSDLEGGSAKVLEIKYYFIY